MQPKIFQRCQAAPTAGREPRNTMTIDSWILNEKQGIAEKLELRVQIVSSL